MSDIKYHRIKIGEIKSGLQMIDRLTTGNLSHHKNYLRNLLNIYLKETEEVANGVTTGEEQCNLPVVMRCSYCADEIKEGEQEYVHKKGFGCCIPEETEKDETHYELFGTTDCDPE